MQGVSEVHAFAVPRQRLAHAWFVLAARIRQGQQRFQRPVYGRDVKAVEPAQDLFCFEQHGLGEKDSLGFEQPPSQVRLPVLVGREQTDDDGRAISA